MRLIFSVLVLLSRICHCYGEANQGNLKFSKKILKNPISNEMRDKSEDLIRGETFSFKNTNSQFSTDSPNQNDYIYTSSSNDNVIQQFTPSQNAPSNLNEVVTETQNRNENENEINGNKDYNARFNEASKAPIKSEKAAMINSLPKIISRYEYDLMANGIKRGLTGLDGDTGRRGKTGPIGIKGDIGVKGPNAVLDPSIKGPKGAIGLAGDQGDRGEVGNPGDSGDFGDEGEVGEKGKRGRDGKDGIDGKLGQRGPKGPKGVKGTKGSTGKDSKTGPVGYKGDNGDVGLVGPQGLQGPQGKKGPRGGNPKFPPKPYLQNLTSSIIVEELINLLTIDPPEGSLAQLNKTNFIENLINSNTKKSLDREMSLTNHQNGQLDSDIKNVMEKCNLGKSNCPLGCSKLINGLETSLNENLKAKRKENIELLKKFEEDLIKKAKACGVQWRR